MTEKDSTRGRDITTTTPTPTNPLPIKTSRLPLFPLVSAQNSQKRTVLLKRASASQKQRGRYFRPLSIPTRSIRATINNLHMRDTIEHHAAHVACVYLPEPSSASMASLIIHSPVSPSKKNSIGSPHNEQVIAETSEGALSSCANAHTET